MGFFSYNCAVCKKPVLNVYAAGGDYPQTALVTVFTENGSVIKGAYDGYGGVEGFELVERDESSWRIAHQMCDQGQSFATLSPPEPDRYQGHFIDDATLFKLFGPPKFPQRRIG